MARVPTFQNRSQVQPANQVIAVPTGFSDVWNNVAKIGQEMADGARREEAREDASRDQLQLGTERQARADAGLFGETVYSQEYNRVTETGYVAGKKTQAETKFAELRTKFANDPERMKEEIDGFQESFLDGMSDQQRMVFTPYFQGQAETAQLFARTTVAKGKFDENRANIESRIKQVINNNTALIRRDPWSVELEDGVAELQQLLGAAKEQTEFGQVLTPTQVRSLQDQHFNEARQAEMLFGFENLKNDKDRNAYIRKIETRQYEGPIIQPAYEQSAISEMKRLMVLDSAGKAAGAAALREDMGDQLASMAGTGVIQGNIVNRVRETFGDEAADEYSQDMELARRGHIGFKNILADPENLSTILESLEPSPAEDNYADRAKVYSQVQQQVSQLYTRMNPQSPQYDPVSTLSQAYGTNDPNELLSLQERWGIPAHQRRLLTNNQAKTEVDHLQQLPPSQQVDYLKQKREKLGDPAFRVQMRQLVDEKMDPGVQVLLNAGNISPVYSRMISQALDLPDKDVTAAIIDINPKAPSEIRAEIASKLEDYRVSLFGDATEHELSAVNSKRWGAFSQYRDVMRRAAQVQVMQGKSVDEAVKIVTEPFLSQWQFQDGYRVPSNVNPREVRKVTDDFVKNEVRNMTFVEEETFAKEQKLTVEQARERIAGHVRDNGYWLTNEDDTGLILMSEFGLPVHKMENGQPVRIELRFKDVPSKFREITEPKKGNYPAGFENLSRFDAEGSGYDMPTAERFGMTKGEDGHYGSVLEVRPEDTKRYGLPPDSYLMLKGRRHPTWHLGVQGEEERGYEVIKRGGRYFSVPKGRK